jgi:hypothetical protein
MTSAQTRLAGNKNVLAFDDTLLDFFLKCLPNLILVLVDDCTVEMTIAHIDGVFDCLLYFARS